MRFSIYKAIFGLVFIAIGVFLILYAQHHLHHEIVAEAKPFFQRVRDWFVGVGDWFKSTAVPTTPPPHSRLTMQITLWVGAAVTAIGALMLIFSRKRF